jgi:hypothetical protein
MTTSMINKRTDNEKLCAICFLQQRKPSKLAFFRFLECSLRKANDLFAAQIILARQPTFSDLFFRYFFNIKYKVYARSYL